jgi:uncharacterized phage protein gp47/JayE
MPTPSGLAPTISATGITAGSFSDWLAYLVAQYQAIYGDDVYLGSDSQDGQFIAVLAQALADCCAAAIAVYNSFSPANAQGAGLSSNVKINGLKRLVPTNSTVLLTLVGVANTTITNGQAIDTAGNVWNLPPSVTIPLSGTINVLATAVAPGAIAAAANTVTGIQTPVYGWQTVNNASPANAGAPVETDAALRVRQSQSVALPSVTIFEGIVAAIEDLPGVTRVKGYENNTGSVDANGIAANTLYFLVEGGVQAAIQNAIFEKITPGIPTKGSISTTITDTVGSTRLIKYDTPTDATITVAITVHGLAGWNTSTEPLIQQAVVNYLNSLPIGSNISYTGMMIPAYLTGTPYFGTFNITALTLKKNAGAAAAADVTINYNEAPIAGLGNVPITVV